MSTYRRARAPGGTYFFTLVTYRRRKLFLDPRARSILRESVKEVHRDHPFKIDAWVLLPEHLHCVWTLPTGDADYSTRLGKIKAGFSKQAKSIFHKNERMNNSRRIRRESTLWQRRFWEHEIRDEIDFQKHVDYVHYNPLKHGLVDCLKDWPYSTFHRRVKLGLYPADWAGFLDAPGASFGE